MTATILLLGNDASGFLQASQAPVEATQPWKIAAMQVGYTSASPDFPDSFSTRKVAQKPVPHAHSHNDYLRKRPIWDALDAGFTSLEVDVFLHHNELVVSHVPRGLSRKPDLESLYFQPLWQHVQANGGRVYAADASSLTLMIDFKSSGTATLALLVEIMQRYPGLFEAKPGHAPPVKVLISGSRPDPEQLRSCTLPVALDGRIEHLGAYQSETYPWISASWRSLFGKKRWDELSDRDQLQVETWCARAKASGQQLRFWATPEDPELWAKLLEIGVYRINTDRPARFSAFWQGQADQRSSQD